jgi:hypothetical protein
MKDKQIKKMVNTLVDLSYRLADERDYDEVIAPSLEKIIAYLVAKAGINQQLKEYELDFKKEAV